MDAMPKMLFDSYIYKYPRLLKINRQVFEKRVISDSKNVIFITIPDGILTGFNTQYIINEQHARSLSQNDETTNRNFILPTDIIYSSDYTKRLYIYSEKELSADELKLCDSYYDQQDARPYPLIGLAEITSFLPYDWSRKRCPPLSSFYMIDDEYDDSNVNKISDQISTLTRFVEYRYFEDRHTVTNRLWLDKINVLVPLVLERAPSPIAPRLVLVLPDNFVCVDNFTGFWYFEAENLLISLSVNRNVATITSSKKINELDSPYEKNRFEELRKKVNRVSPENDTELSNIVCSFIRQKLNIFNISINKRSIKAYDEYVTVSVGA